MFQRLFCTIGRHRRSVWRRYRGDDGLYRSRCRGCGVAMLRDADGRWTKEAGAEPERGVMPNGWWPFRRRGAKPME